MLLYLCCQSRYHCCLLKSHWRMRKRISSYVSCVYSCFFSFAAFSSFYLSFSFSSLDDPTSFYFQNKRVAQSDMLRYTRVQSHCLLKFTTSDDLHSKYIHLHKNTLNSFPFSAKLHFKTSNLILPIVCNPQVLLQNRSNTIFKFFNSQKDKQEMSIWVL